MQVSHGRRVEGDMKRIVVLIDGTWNKEATTGNTNVATLDPGMSRNLYNCRGGGRHRAARALSRRRWAPRATFFKKLLGGAIGVGLKQIIKECYGFLVADYVPGDEIYIVGFSRGAYAARALAGPDRGVRAFTPGGRRHVRNRVATLSHQAAAYPPASSKGASSADRKTIAEYQALDRQASVSQFATR